MLKFVKPWFFLALLIGGIAGIAAAAPGHCLQFMIMDDTPNALFYAWYHADVAPPCNVPTDDYVWAPQASATPESCPDCPLRLTLKKPKGQASADTARECQGLKNALPVNYVFKDKIPKDAPKKGGGTWHPKDGIAVHLTKWVFVKRQSGDPIPVKLFKFQMDYKAAGLPMGLDGQPLGPMQWIGYEMKKMPDSEKETAPEVSPTALVRPCKYMGTLVIDESTNPVMVVSSDSHPLFN